MCSVFIWQLSFVTKKDTQEYEALLQSSSQKNRGNIPFCSSQNRTKIMKEIWLGRMNQNPRYMRITSPHSEFVIEKRKNRFEVFEKMENVTCLFQEKLYFASDQTPMQELRYFEAEKGVCNYTLSDFVGYHVVMKKFTLPGHHLSTPSFLELTPISKGLCEKVFLVLEKEGDLDVKMTGMQTTFNPKEGI